MTVFHKNSSDLEGEISALLFLALLEIPVDKYLVQDYIKITYRVILI